MITKEAIELVEKIKARGIFDRGAINQLDQLLALLKEQPPASDFTKVQRLAIESCEASYEGDEWLPIGLQRLDEAYDSSDASEASRKALLATCEKHKKVHIESYGNTSWMANYSDMEVAIKANK